MTVALPDDQVSDPAGPKHQLARQYAELTRLLPTWFWTLDASYCLTHVDWTSTVHTGVSIPDLIGICVLDPRYGEDTHEAGLGPYMDALRQQKVVDGFIYERLLFSGERVVFMDSALPCFDHDGTFQGYTGLTLHLSKVLARADSNGSLVSELRNRADALEDRLKLRNAELEERSSLLREIVNGMNEGLLVTTGQSRIDRTNTVEFANPAYLRQFGLTTEQVHKGVPFPDLITLLRQRDDHPGGPDGSDLVLNGEPEMTFEIKSQKRIINCSATKRLKGGLVLVHNDITELETRTRALIRARKEADVANAAKSAFLAAMSHEIRTPMNGIVGMSDLLAETTLDDTQRDYVDTIRNSALALNRLIADILDFSTIEAGKLTFDKRAFCLATSCRDVVALLRPLAEGKGLTLVLDAPAAGRDWHLGDEPRIRQVLVNILGNAIKFTLSGGVYVRLDLSRGVMIAIRDTGIGISADNIARIFSPFEQVQGGLQRRFQGTGLGLSITKSLIDGMGGDISVDSAEGQGTTFVVTLPLEPADPPALAAGHAKSQTSIRDLRILVAEDNKTNQKVVRHMLERAGARVVLTDDGRAAVEAFAPGSFDAVLMDLSMPRLNGLDAARLIRAAEQDADAAPVPIFALSGNAFPKDRADALAAGMTGFLCKPFRYSDLVSLLEGAQTAGSPG